MAAAIEHRSGPVLGPTPVPVPQTIQYPKWFGGSSSCFAVVCSHPLDLIKVRLQTSTAVGGTSVVALVSKILREEKIRGLYKGLSAGLLRQRGTVTYGTTRFAIYESIKERITTSTGKPASTSQLIPVAFVSGICGAIVGNPSDIANVRMQNAQATLASNRPPYRGVFDVLARIVREEGVQGLMRGVGPNSLRAGVMTSCQLASYDGLKRSLQERLGMSPDSTLTQLTASLLAGLLATTLCSPLDVLKTRVMSSSGNGGGLSIQGIIQITRNEGWRWIFRGWLPSFSRLVPHTMATLLFLEQHRKVYRQLVGRE